MKPENKALVLMTLGVATVIVAGGIGILSQPRLEFGPSNFPSTLPIAAGAVIHFWPLQPNQEGTFVVTFDVAYPSGHFVGRWFADHGGAVYILPANNTMLIPHHHYCDVPWSGSADISFVAGQYVMQFYGPRWDNITVEDTIQVEYPGGAMGTGLGFFASPC